MHFTDNLKDKTYETLSFIKSMKDLVSYVEAEAINFENILFEGSLFDYGTPYEIAEVKKQGSFLYVITNFYGVLAKQNILPDVYRDMIFDNKLLYSIMHLFNDCSVKLVFYAAYLKYCSRYREQIVSSLLRADLNVSMDHLIGGALTVVNPLTTFGKINYLVRAHFVHDFILGLTIENRDLIYVEKDKKAALDQTRLNTDTLGTMSYTSRNLKITLTISAEHFSKVVSSIKILRKQLSSFAYSYMFVLETRFVDLDKMQAKVDNVFVSHSSVLVMEKTQNSVLVYL